MKKFGKILTGLGVVTAVSALGYYFYKKERRKIDQHEEKIREDVESAGLSYEALRNEVTSTDEEEGNSFMKALATALFMNPNVPEEFLDVDSALRAKSVIHIRETTRKNQRYLELLFEIPNYAKSFLEEEKLAEEQQGYRPKVREPMLRDYIRCIRDMAEEVNNEIIKGPRPRVCPEVYALVHYIEDTNHSLNNNDDVSGSYFLIPREVYKAYATEQHDGLDEFFIDMVREDAVDEGGIQLLCEAADLTEMNPELFEVVDLVVMINVSFKIADVGGGFGINILNAPKVICKFIEDLEVNIGFSKSRKTAVRFENLIIHPNESYQLEDGREIPFSFYEREKGHIVRSDYK